MRTSQPKTVCLIGQYAGVGKSTAIKEYKDFFQQKLGLHEGGYKIISIGDTLKEYYDEPCFKRLARVQNTGSKVEWAAAMSILAIHFHTNHIFLGDTYLVLDGVRGVPEIEYFLSLGRSGIIAPPTFICIESGIETCYKRLVKRTKEDKRTDLSMKGKPGIPDPEKIMHKLNWEKKLYDECRVHIQKNVPLSGYNIFLNNGSECDFRNLIKEDCERLFFDNKILA